jgi:hypothetical protein
MLRKNYLLAGWIFFILSCSVSVNPPMYEDPTDPDNPYYIEPGITVYSEFQPGDTLTENEFIVSWQGAVLDSCEFTWTIDSIFFSDWSTDTSLYIPPQDEGWHLFEIRMRYFSGVEQEINYVFPFYIDAVQGPSLRLSRPYQEIPIDESCEFDIWLEEVENWSGGRITLVWDHTKAYVFNHQIHEESYDILMQNNSSLISRVEQYNDSLVLELGLVDDLATGISGSGRIASVTFQPLNSPTLLEIRFGANSDFRDANNQSIPIAEMPGGMVVYK